MLTSKLVISNKNNKERGQLKSWERVITYGKIVIKLYCTSDRLRINKAVLWDNFKSKKDMCFVVLVVN